VGAGGYPVCRPRNGIVADLRGRQWDDLRPRRPEPARAAAGFGGLVALGFAESWAWWLGSTVDPCATEIDSLGMPEPPTWGRSPATSWPWPGPQIRPPEGGAPGPLCSSDRRQGDHGGPHV